MRGKENIEKNICGEKGEDGKENKSVSDGVISRTK